MLPVMALAPQENEKVLDMAAAPGEISLMTSTNILFLTFAYLGGKTTHIAALMRNTGLLYANDANRSRAKAVVGNLHRLGLSR